MITREYAQHNLIPMESKVLDSDGKEYLFTGLDDDGDLIVECRAAMGGRIVLYRERCSVPSASK